MHTIELLEGNGIITVKLTPAIEKDGSLRIAADTTRVEASGVLGEMLRSGSLGDSLRETIEKSFLMVLQNGMNVKSMLPPAVRDSVTIQTAKFIEASGASTLGIVLSGQMRLSGRNVSTSMRQVVREFRVENPLLRAVGWVD